MTETELAALTKGQKLYSAWTLDNSATLSESTYLGRTSKGLYRLRSGRSGSIYHEREAVLLGSCYLTKVEAAEAGLTEASEALEQAKAAHAKMAALLVAAREEK